MRDPQNRFDLPFLVDNGTLRNWATDIEPDCLLVRCHDDDSYSVLDRNDKPLAGDDDKEGALMLARIYLTNRRREADGIIPAKVC